MCVTGSFNLMCPIRSRLTIASVISTSHLSQTFPLFFTFLYFPQLHS